MNSVGEGVVLDDKDSIRQDNVGGIVLREPEGVGQEEGVVDVVVDGVINDAYHRVVNGVGDCVVLGDKDCIGQGDVGGVVLREPEGVGEKNGVLDVVVDGVINDAYHRVVNGVGNCVVLGDKESVGQSDVGGVVLREPEGVGQEEGICQEEGVVQDNQAVSMGGLEDGLQGAIGVDQYLAGVVSVTVAPAEEGVACLGVDTQGGVFAGEIGAGTCGDTVVGGDSQGIPDVAEQSDIVDGGGSLLAERAVVVPVEDQPVPSVLADLGGGFVVSPRRGEVEFLPAVEGDSTVGKGAGGPTGRRGGGIGGRQRDAGGDEGCTEVVVGALAIAAPVEGDMIAAGIEPEGGIGEDGGIAVGDGIGVGLSGIVADIESPSGTTGGCGADDPRIGSSAVEERPPTVVGRRFESGSEVLEGALFFVDVTPATPCGLHAMRETDIVDPGAVGAVGPATVFLVGELQHVAARSDGEGHRRPTDFARSDCHLHTVEIAAEVVVVGL